MDHYIYISGFIYYQLSWYNVHHICTHFKDKINASQHLRLVILQLLSQILVENLQLEVFFQSGSKTINILGLKEVLINSPKV